MIDHLGLGGAQNQLLDLVESGDPRIEHEVVSLGPRALPGLTARLEAAGIPFRSLNLSKRDPSGFLDMRRYLAGARPDVLQTRLDYSNSFGVAAVASLGRLRPRVLRTVEDDPGCKYAWPLRRCARYVTRWVDAEVVISESLRRAVERAFPGPPRPIEVIPPGLDLARFGRPLVDPAVARELRAGAARVVGTVGRLSDQKNLGTLLAAMPRLNADGRTRLLVVGDGPRRASLERFASHLGVRDSVAFLGYRSDMVNVYAAMDVFALPSRHEGFGIVLLEAMCMEVPVVGTRVVGIVDAIQDEITGLVVPPGDSHALADAILRLLSDGDLARSLAGRAHDRVRAIHSREAMAARTEEVYRRLLHPRRP